MPQICIIVRSLKGYVVHGNRVLSLETSLTALTSAPAKLCPKPAAGEGPGFQQQHLKRAGPEKSWLSSSEFSHRVPALSALRKRNHTQRTLARAS